MSVPSPVSRRGLLQAAAAGAAVVAAGPLAAATAAPAYASSTAFNPLRRADLHLAARSSFGATPALLAEIDKIGPERWLDRQLAPSTVSDTACDGYVARFTRLPWTIHQARTNLANGAWDVMFELGQATLVRQVWSRRQLFEVMVDFWSNHLNVTNPSSEVWDNRHDYDRAVVRKHALGRFADLLAASATHPAMLRYLNNADSTKDQPNENYGRELLELHTVGVDGGYDETDMRNSTLVMTGFGVHDNWRDPTDPKIGSFEYHAGDHYVGPVSVMGWSADNGSAGGGQQVAMAYLGYLARHPSTARRIADKLVTRFVDDAPVPSLSDRLATTYVANDTQIVPVLRELFASPEFAEAAGSKVKRPMEDLAATLRILGVRPQASGTDGLRSLYWIADSLGNAPMAWSLPDGYPDVATAWQSASGTLGRWNAHLSVAARWWPTQLTFEDLRGLLPATLPATYGGYVDALCERLLFQRLPTAERDAVLTFLGKTAGQALKPTDAALGWRFPYAVALILDSSTHAMR